MVITDEAGNLAHSEMGFGGGLIMIGNEWNDITRSPASIGGKNTQTVRVAFDGDIDAHCARARAAGAVIMWEPADEFYGARVYAAIDPEGHAWSFSKTLRYVSREEAEKASGLKIEGWIEP